MNNALTKIATAQPSTSGRSPRFGSYLLEVAVVRVKEGFKGDSAIAELKVRESAPLAGTHLLIRCEVYPKQLPAKDNFPGKVINGYRWSHVELNDEQLAQVEQARKASKLPALADALA